MEQPKTEIKTGEARTFPLHGICLEHVLDAAKECVDTSILERLFPWAFETIAGKTILDDKAAERVAQRESSETKKEKEEFVIKMDKRTLNAVASMLGCFGGAPGGPRGAMESVSKQLKHQGAEDTYFRVAGRDKATYLPNTWEEFEKERFKSED